MFKFKCYNETLYQSFYAHINRRFFTSFGRTANPKIVTDGDGQDKSVACLYYKLPMTAKANLNSNLECNIFDLQRILSVFLIHSGYFNYICFF